MFTNDRPFLFPFDLSAHLLFFFSKCSAYRTWSSGQWNDCWNMQFYTFVVQFIHIHACRYHSQVSTSILDNHIAVVWSISVFVKRLYLLVSDACSCICRTPVSYLCVRASGSNFDLSLIYTHVDSWQNLHISHGHRNPGSNWVLTRIHLKSTQLHSHRQ